MQSDMTADGTRHPGADEKAAPATHKPVRLAMVGGGPRAFIGPVHRMAAELDGRMTLVAGCFSRDIEKSRQAGAMWGVDPERVHAEHESLFASEAARSDGAELIAVVTPNASHHEIVKAALETGFHVAVDKPMTASLEQAREIAAIAARAKGTLTVTYTYTGYPMVRAARDLVARGEIGEVRKVVVEYVQGWLSRPVELEGNPQAAWRTDPASAGAGGCIGDIGSHAFNLAEFVTGLKASAICAGLTSFSPGRRLDDDCNALIRFENGAAGVLHASQIANGERNELRVRVWGERGGIDWRHDESDRLALRAQGRPERIYHAGEDCAGPNACAGRLPSGHPEGFIEAFANIYRDVAESIRTGIRSPSLQGAESGLRGLVFADRSIASAQERSWVNFV